MSVYKCLKQQEYTHGSYSIVPLRYEDRFAIMNWRNEQVYHLRQDHLLTEGEQQAYFDNVISKLYGQLKPEQILFSYLKDGLCIGYGGLVHINWIDLNAEISFIMDTLLEAKHFSEHWCNFLDMLKQSAFNDLHLHKIYTYAFDIRPNLYPILEANGFYREATLKEHCRVEGLYKDVVVHSCLETYQVINYTDCTREQLEDILSLRNNKDIRKWMVNQEVISEDRHFRFVEALKGDQDKLYFAVYMGGELIGTYNLIKQKEGIWERGIIAAPKAQGRGETIKWERYIIRLLPQHGVNALTAKVKIDNVRSIRYHVRVGYKEQSRDKEYIYFLLEIR